MPVKLCLVVLMCVPLGAVVSGGRPLNELGASTPEVAVELTSKSVRKAWSRGRPSRFVIVMMAPRVGSTMLCSQLQSYEHGIVHVRKEGVERGLLRERPDLNATERLRLLYEETEAAAAHKAQLAGKRVEATGFKTERSLVWVRGALAYARAPEYDNASATPSWKALGVRVVCLARLNALAWDVSGTHKASKSNDAIDLDCGKRKFVARLGDHVTRVEVFHRECRAIAEETRALWLPYEAIKDGSPRQAASLGTLASFLNLEAGPDRLAAKTTHFLPGATSTHLKNASTCRAAFRESPYLTAMLDDPVFPYGPESAAAHEVAHVAAPGRSRRGR